MENKQNKRSLLPYVHILIAFVLMLIFRFIPAPSPMTQLGMQVIGIFVGMMYGWLTSDKIAISILGLVMLGLTEYCTVPEAIGKAFSNNTALLVFFFFMVAGILNEAGVTEVIALKMTNSRLARKNPYLLVLMLCLTACLLHVLISATAACMVLYPLIKRISIIYGFEPKNRFATFMCLGISFVGAVAYSVLPFHTISAIGFGAYEAAMGESINYVRYVICMVLLMIIDIAAFLGYCGIFERKTMDAMKQHKQDKSFSDVPSMTRYQKQVLIFFVVLIVVMLVPDILPTSIGIVAFIKSIGSMPLVALSLAVYAFIQFREGKKLQFFFSKSISWEVFFLLASALTVAGAILSEESGIQSWVEETVLPSISGNGVYIPILIIVVCAIILTNLTNHGAVAAIFAPVACTLAGTLQGASINLQGLMVLVIMASSVGLCTPAAGANATLMFGDTEWFDAKMLSSIGLKIVFTHLVILMTLGYLLASWIL